LSGRGIIILVAGPLIVAALLAWALAPRHAHSAPAPEGIWPPDDYPRAYVVFMSAFAGCRMIERLDTIDGVHVHWVTAVRCPIEVR
jgi:hypothetical protein